MSKKDMSSLYKHNAHVGKIMGIFTSGVDSPGMNAALRANVRMALYLGIKVYLIKEGYQGMIDGGDNFIEANWLSVFKIVHRGGSVIGSAGSAEFYVRENRLKAALNLVQRNITHLVVIGGDGSLTGAQIFRQEWKLLLEELFRNEKITMEEKETNDSLFIIGLVSSIDNDFCGTEMTIGTDSGLHRIVESFDAIQSMQYFDQHAFILEIIGKHCGYLALSTALAIGADFLFVPESPVNGNWIDVLCEKLSQSFKGGNHLNIIVAAEGAIDRDGKPITTSKIQEVLVSQLKIDVTILDHIQCSGNPSAFDRVLAARMGIEAITALAESTSNSESIVIALQRNNIYRLSLMECVQRTKSVADAIAAKDFETAMELRGKSFKKKLEMYRMLTRINPPILDPNTATTSDQMITFNLAVMHIGPTTSGMNAAVRSFTRSCLNSGHLPLGICDGIKGLVAGDIQEMGWYTVSGWVGKTGALLGSNCLSPEHRFKQIAERFKEFNIKGLLIIGGFEAYTCCGKLFEQRANYPEFCIPLLVIPATIHNNVPGTEVCVGTDTALNVITEICDNFLQTVQDTKRGVYIIETMSDYCGYLPTLASVASGVDTAYIFEEKFNIKDLQRDLEHAIKKINAGIPLTLILRGEKANANYTADFIYRLYSEEGKSTFTCKTNVIGGMQHPGSTTPFDRNLATKLAAYSVDWFVDLLKNNIKTNRRIHFCDNESACVLGFSEQKYKFTPIAHLVCQTDFDHRLPAEQWWLKLRPILKVLSLHYTAFEKEYDVGFE